MRSPSTSFTSAPKPSSPVKGAGKKKSHKIRNTLLLALLGGSGFVAAAAYASQDTEFGQQFEHYVPGANQFMDLVRYHDDSVFMALTEIGFKAYDDVVYTSRFIYTQFSSLLNMLKHNSWTDPSAASEETASKKRVAPVPSKKENPSSSGAMPMKNIQVAVELPPLDSQNKSVKELSKALSAVVDALNKKGLSPSNVQQIKVLSDALIALDKDLGSLKDEEKKAIEVALTEERVKFEKSLSEFQAASHVALVAREAELIEARDKLLGEAASAADKRIVDELSAQRDLLERRFNRFVRARVSEERGGRLAQLDRVEGQLRQLGQMAQESGELIKQSQAVSRLGVAIAALKGAVVSSPTQKPFASELSSLASVATTDFPATRAAIDSISRDAAEQGIPSMAELEDRFDAVRREIRSVSLVPENGNFGSQVLSVGLSKIMFNKEGLVEGDDVEAVLSRTDYFLQQHNLDMAARELNQLKGWPKKLAGDWISAARRRLEVEQAVGIAEAEEMLAKITFI